MEGAFVGGHKFKVEPEDESSVWVIVGPHTSGARTLLTRKDIRALVRALLWAHSRLEE